MRDQGFCSTGACFGTCIVPRPKGGTRNLSRQAMPELFTILCDQRRCPHRLRKLPRPSNRRRRNSWAVPGMARHKGSHEDPHLECKAHHRNTADHIQDHQAVLCQ